MSSPKESKVDVLIIGAGPAGLMAALWMSRYGIKTRIIDRRERYDRVGQADGIQIRTLELFESFGIADTLLKQSCHVVEMSIWNPGDDGNIQRAIRTINTMPDISRYSNGVLLAQHRIEGIILDSLADYNTIEVQRSVEPISLAYDDGEGNDQSLYPVKIKIEHLKTEKASDQASVLDGSKVVATNGEEKTGERGVSEQPPMQEIIRAKYVIGCDGAHSWTRRQLGFQMEGEQSEYVWAVLDIIPITDFPDLRTRCAIHSATAGSIMMVPREDKLVRFYCQLSEVKPGQDGRFDRSKITPDVILKAAQKILHPYQLEYKHCDWWTVYQIGQRVGTQFSAHDRIFLAGDAIHTHSPKAGQGMNISMQDTYNLGWKLGLVVRGIAKPSILKTYESERRTFAKELIEFDKRWSTLFSKPPAKDTADEEFLQAFQRQKLFTTGVAVDYGPSCLMAKSTITHDEKGSIDTSYGPNAQQAELQTKNKQYLATKLPLGQRFSSFRVINHCSAQSWHLGTLLKSEGQFYIVLFAGDVSKTEQMQRVHDFTRALAEMATPLVQHGSRDHHIARILTIHSTPRQQVEFFAFPDLLRPFNEEHGWDYDRIYADEESYHDGYGNAYENYGIIDRSRGCVVVLRPDQHVAWIGDLEDTKSLEDYFTGFLIRS